MESRAEMLAAALGEDPEAVAAAWDEAIQRRVEGIRNGTGHWPELEEVLAELDRCEAEFMDDSDEDDDDDDPAEVEAAWASEIQRRVDEIRGGTAKTYAAEDVIAAMRLRFGWLDSAAEAELDDDSADVEAAWADEIKRRVDEIRNGTVETYALEDVLAEMEERYG
jgi:hypothetical protein